MQIDLGTIISILSLTVGSGCLIKLLEFIKSRAVEEERKKVHEEKTDKSIEALAKNQNVMAELINEIKQDGASKKLRDDKIDKAVELLTDSQMAMEKNIDLLKSGNQAILRDMLLESYNRAAKKGYMSYEEKETWMNSYANYHALGSNGVMDSVRDKVADLPFERGE